MQKFMTFGWYDFIFTLNSTGSTWLSAKQGSSILLSHFTWWSPDEMLLFICHVYLKGCTVAWSIWSSCSAQKSNPGLFTSILVRFAYLVRGHDGCYDRNGCIHKKAKELVWTILTVPGPTLMLLASTVRLLIRWTLLLSVWFYYLINIITSLLFLQFGSRIARESNRKFFGSNRAANQASAGSVAINK